MSAGRPRRGFGARDLLGEAWSGIVAHRVRSLLSGLGILFGVAAVIGILSIGEGARREQEELISRLGILNIAVRNRDLSADPEAEKEIRRVSPGLSLSDVAALEGAITDAAYVGGMRELPATDVVPRPKDPARLALIGADPSWLAGSTLALVRGRPLTDKDERLVAPVCLVGREARRLLFGINPAIGQRIRVGTTWLIVVGEFEDGGEESSLEGVALQNRNATVITPLSTALRRIARPPLDEEKLPEPELSEIQVTVQSIGAVEARTALASRTLARTHRDQPDFDMVIPARLLEQSRAQQRLFSLVMGTIAGISLLVGGIGIMNIMLATVLERTREIGVRLAIGARPSDITALFLAESMLISLTGGLFGVGAGLLLSRLVAAATGWSVAVSPTSVLLATVIAGAEGVIFGYLPALRASRMPPSIVLRG